MPKLRLTNSLRARRGLINSFSPLSLSPALWLDASNSASLFQSNGGAAATADGDPVGYALDLSGNANHFSQTDPTKKPALRTAVKNGRNVLRLDGANDCLINSSLSSSVTSLWIFAAYKVNNVASQYVFDNVTGFRPYYFYDGGNINYGGNFKAQAVPDTAIVGINYKANPYVPYRNGALVTGLSGTATTPGATTGVTLGSYYAASGYFMNGDFYEYIRIHSALSAQNITDLFSYLNAKWAVY